MKLSRFAFVTVALAFGSALVACGGSSSDGDGNTDPINKNFPVSGTPLLAAADKDYLFPMAFAQPDGTTLFYRNSTGFFIKTGEQEPVALQMVGDANVNLGVTNLAMNGSYIAWNVNSPNTSVSRFTGNATISGSTGQLVGGMCMVKDDKDVERLIGMQESGTLVNAPLGSTLKDPSAISKQNLLDPEFAPDMLSVKAFACAGKTGIIATTDGRIYKLTNILNGTPTLAKLAEGEKFAPQPLLQYSHPYIVWMDANNDVRSLNLSDAAPTPKLAINIDPQNRTNNAPVLDMRIFDSVVVWSDKSEGSYDVWAADLATMPDENTYPQVTNDAKDQRFPYIFNGVYYWQDNRNGKWEIWSYDSRK